MVAFKLLAFLGSVVADIKIDNICQASTGGSCEDADVTSALQSRRVHHRLSHKKAVSSGRAMETATAGKEGLLGGSGGGGFSFESLFVDKKSIEQLDSEVKELTAEIERVSDDLFDKSADAHQQFLAMLDANIPPEVDLQKTYENLMEEVEEMQEKLENLEAKARKRFETLTQKLQNTVSDVADEAQEKFDEMTLKLVQAQEDMAALFERTRLRFDQAKQKWAETITAATEQWDAKVALVREEAEHFKQHLIGEVREALNNTATEAMSAALIAVERAAEAEEWMAGQIRKVAARAEQLEAKAQQKLFELSVIVRDQRIKAQQLYDAAKESAKDRLVVLKTKAQESFDEVQTKMQNTYDDVTARADELFTNAQEKVVAGVQAIKDEAADFTDRAQAFKDELAAGAAEASDEVKDAIRQKRQEAEAMKEKLVQTYSRTALKLEEMIMDKIEAAKAKIESQVIDARLKWEAAQNGFAEAVDETTENLKESYEALRSKRDEVAQKVEEARQRFNDAKDKIKAAMAAAKEATKEAIDEINDAFKDLGDAIRDIFSR